MNFYTCQEDPGDTVAVTACTEGVLVVIRSEGVGKVAELELTAPQAREAADAIRALVADPTSREGYTYGPLYVTEGSEDGTIFLSDNPNSGEVRSVVLSTKDAESVAAHLCASASDWETAELERAFEPSPAAGVMVPVLTADQLTRAAAVTLAAQALGTTRGAYIVAAAEFILTGDVIA